MAMMELLMLLRDDIFERHDARDLDFVRAIGRWHSAASYLVIFVYYASMMVILVASCHSDLLSAFAAADVVVAVAVVVAVVGID
jgi:hypothetical protein